MQQSINLTSTALDFESWLLYVLVKTTTKGAKISEKLVFFSHSPIPVAQSNKYVNIGLI